MYPELCAWTGLYGADMVGLLWRAMSGSVGAQAGMNAGGA